MRTRPSIPAVALSLVALAVSAAPAQETVPAELAHALLESYQFPGEPAPRFMIGRLPEGIPAEAVLPGAEVMGGIESARRATAVMRVPGEGMRTRELETEITERLVEVGWHRYDPFTTSAVFARPGREQVRPAPPFVCLDDRMLRVSTRPVERTLIVRIEVSRDAPMARSCGEEVAGTGHRVPLPVLTPPEGISIGVTSESGNESGLTVTSRVTAGISPESLADHLATQLVEVGWTVVGRSADETSAHQSFTIADADGTEATATLSVVRLPGEDELILVLVAQRPSAGAPGNLMRVPAALETR